MESFLINFSESFHYLSYLIIFAAILIEGEMFLLLAGILAHSIYFDLYIILTIAFIATALHDIIYWLIGKWLWKSNKKKFLFVNLEKMNGFLERIKINSGFYIFVSKFAYGFNRITLAASGYIGVSFKKLLNYCLPADIILTVSLVSLGYIFADKTEIIKKDIKTAALFITIIIIAIIIFEKFVQKSIEKEQLKSN